MCASRCARRSEHVAPRGPRHRHRHRRRASMPRLFERFHRIEGDARPHARGLRHRARARAASSSRLHGGDDRGVERASAAARRSPSRCPRGTSHLARRGMSARELHVERAARAVLRDGGAALAARHRAGERVARRRTEHSRRGRRALPSRPARILVADDNADMRDYIARLLRAALDGGGRPRRRGGRSRPRVARRPDLVLTDVMMPRLDGFELVRALRARSGDARPIPVILLSARAGEEAVAEGLRVGRRRLPREAVLLERRCSCGWRRSSRPRARARRPGVVPKPSASGSKRCSRSHPRRSASCAARTS